MPLSIPWETIYFECPYCQHKRNLTRLIAVTYIKELTSMFTCWDRWEKSGCEREFLLELKPKHFYATNVVEIVKC